MNAYRNFCDRLRNGECASGRSLLFVSCALAIIAAGCAPVHSVPAIRETAAVSAAGDAADDPAIWIAPQAAQSLVIATQKQGGLYVFDLAGRIVQEAPGGRPNNVDLREGFAWREGPAPLVGASDRTDNTIVLWRFDPVTMRLDPNARARIATGFAEVYGFCLGRAGTEWIAVATGKDGEVGVWRLTLDAQGSPSGERIARYALGSITEGCVFDDVTGAYYLAEETVGIWRAEIGDQTGKNRRLIDRVRGGRLVADVEGLTLWEGPEKSGYLIASVQGESRFAVYDRAGENTYRGTFSIGASVDGRADSVSGTDGIAASSAPLGPDFPRGLLVAQDDENSDPAGLQNFKYVSWADVEAALSLASPP